MDNDISKIIEQGEIEGYKHNNVIAEERMDRLRKKRINEIDQVINELHQNTVEVDMGGSVFAYIIIIIIYIYCNRDVEDPIEIADHKTILRVLESTKQQLKDQPLATPDEIAKLVQDTLNIPPTSPIASYNESPIQMENPETVETKNNLDLSPIRVEPIIQDGQINDIVNKYLQEYDLSPHHSDGEDYNQLISELDRPPLE